jgi:hypothetical protein
VAELDDRAASLDHRLADLSLRLAERRDATRVTPHQGCERAAGRDCLVLRGISDQDEGRVRRSHRCGESCQVERSHRGRFVDHHDDRRVEDVIGSLVVESGEERGEGATRDASRGLEVLCGGALHRDPDHATSRSVPRVGCGSDRVRLAGTRRSGDEADPRP